MDNIQIQIPSLPENIRIVESFIDNAKDQYKLNDDIYGNIMIAVTESVNNAIVHGNQSDSKKNVVLQLALEESLIKFTVEDEGPGFDYNDLPDPTLPENLSKPGGRGIFLMKNLCDEVSFKKDGRVAELSFYLS
ncbi:ATP-binding protein [Ekhidna sp.]|uniref:ATP-binding protein n=1 Tax=Ekhidna sp. TaxID=2608089 RepID=UPI003CCC1C5C